MIRYRAKKWWSLKESPDGQYVAYHEHEEEVNRLKADNAKLLVDGGAYKLGFDKGFREATIKTTMWALAIMTSSWFCFAAVLKLGGVCQF